MSATNAPLARDATAPPKPWLAALLSALLPGLGQLYVGNYRNALIFLFPAAIYNPIMALLVSTGEVRGTLLTIFAAASVAAMGAAAYLAYREACRVVTPPGRWWRSPGFLGLILVAAISLVQVPLAVLLDTFWWYRAASASMRPALEPGTRFVTSSWPFRWRAPEPGEVVVFHRDGEPTIKFVMRVIAVGGDRVEFRAEGVSVNGVPLAQDGGHRVRVAPNEEGMMVGEKSGTRLYRIFLADRSAPARSALSVTVPPNHVYVLGDNRANSYDSRYFGAIPVRNVRDKVIWIFGRPDLEP